MWPYQKGGVSGEQEPVSAFESGLLIQIANSVDLLLNREINRRAESDVLELTFGIFDLVGRRMGAN